jgi:hypothetical protein
VAVYGIENENGTPIYVHAKVCVVDDHWAAVGSDNFNRRSWTYDSELNVAVIDESPSPAGRFAERLRLQLACEHLGRDAADRADLHDAESAFGVFAGSASTLQAWHDDGRAGARPLGRLRHVVRPEIGRWTRLWAVPLYRRLYDPDGRDRSTRRAGSSDRRRRSVPRAPVAAVREGVEGGRDGAGAGLGDPAHEAAEAGPASELSAAPTQLWSFCGAAPPAMAGVSVAAVALARPRTIFRIRGV